MMIGSRSIAGHWIYFKFIAKIKLFELYHKLRPSKHQWRWIGYAECGCCGFEGMRCDVCWKAVIIGDCADAYQSPDGITAGRWYESGY